MKCISSMFQNERIDASVIDAEMCPRITASEVSKTDEQMEDWKAPGPDNPHAEFWKLLDPDGIKWRQKYLIISTRLGILLVTS